MAGGNPPSPTPPFPANEERLLPHLSHPLQEGGKLTHVHACWCREGSPPSPLSFLPEGGSDILRSTHGRCTDSLTGQTYHPTYAPPPEHIRERLVWRIDDTPTVIERRLKEFELSVEPIVEAFKEVLPFTLS